jgi:hypothetical protein
MDWLRKAANWLGNVVKRADPVRAGVSTFQQASREFNRQRPRIEQATRQVAQQLQPPKPRLDYQAAMRALQGMQQQAKRANPTNITKPFLGVTVGDIARQLPGATAKVGTTSADFATKQFFPATRKLAEGGVNTAQALQMRTNLLANQLQGKRVNQNYLNRIAQLEQRGIAPERIRTGKASVGEFGREIVKTGTPVGLEVAPFLGGATQGVAKLGLKQAAPKILKEGLVYGGTKGAYTLGFGEGDIKQRGQQAATDVAMGPLYELLGYGFGRGVGKLKVGKNADEAIQARLKNRPANLQAIENNPNLSNTQRLALAKGDTGQAGLQLSPAQREAMLSQFQGKVRTVNGKKVFAPTYNPTDAKGKPGAFNDNYYPRQEGGLFGNKPTEFMGLDRLKSVEGAPDKARVDFYKKKIEAGEKIDPIIARYDKNGVLEIEDGKHRFEAMRQMGIAAHDVVIQNKNTINPKTGMGKKYFNKIPKSYLEPDAPKGKLNAKEKAMGEALGLSEADTLAAKQGGTGLDRTINLDGSQAIPGAPKGQVKRGFVKSLQDDWGVPSKLADDLPQGYKPIKNADTFAQAKQIVDSEPDSLQRLLSKPKDAITELDQAQLQIHLRKAIGGDDLKAAGRIATKIDVNARQAGRTVQILAAWKKTTPEGALSEAFKVVEEANAKYPGKNFEVSPEKAANIRKLAENIQKTTAGTRDRQVAQALLEKEIKGIVPATIGRKLSSLQTFAQLLNPKTAIRNVIGNAVFGTMENISTATAAGVDKIIGVGTKQRSVALPNLKVQGKGFLKGAKYGIEDTKLGIRTSGSETQFEIKPNVFKNKFLKGVEKVLGYELSVPDKAFYQGAFEDSLNNQMRAMKLDKPNPLVIEQANQEALYRTFQNDSKLATILSGVKKGLNFNKEFGAGDFILKYPRTPGNIAQAGLFDYSPLGGAQGLYRLGKGIKQGNLDPFSQREAALQIGRGITGTGLLAGGAALAKGGVLQGRPDTDKDVNNLDRSIGGGPYTFNISALTRGFNGGNQPGDKILNYDWLQPTAIPVTMGANLANRKTAGDMVRDVTGTIDAGVQTLVDQPVLQGLARIVGSTGTGGTGIGDTLLQTAQSIPSSFMPSILNQVGQYTDPISRSTYDPNFVGGMVRQVKGRVPGLRTGLEPNMDTFGNERKMYEDNNFFNVFFNPAFQRTYQPTPEAQLVLDLNQQTGETSQFPRVAPRKLTVNGQQTTLTPDQITAYQKYTGEKTKQWYQSFNSDRRFQALSNEDKIKVMQNALTDIAAAGKIAVLGQNPEGADSRVKAIAEDQAADFIPKPKKVKQPKAPKGRRGRRKSTRKVGTRTGRKRGRVAKVVPKVPRLTSGIKSSGGSPIRRVSAKRTPRLKFASAPKSSKTVKIKLG